MSIEAMNHAFKQSVGSPTAKAVFVTLANMADHQGRCFPSIGYLSGRTELTRRTVQSSLRQLEAKGFIKTVSRVSRTGSKSNIYLIDLGGAHLLHGGAQEVQEGAHMNALGGAGDAPITINNNQITKEPMSESDDPDVSLFMDEYKRARKSWQPRNPNDNNKKAEKAWKARMRAKVSPADLKAGMERYNAYCKAFEKPPNMIMHLSTFLNADEQWTLPWTITEKAIRLPTADDALVPWARERGLSMARPGESFAQFRHRLGGEARRLLTEVKA